MPIPFYIFFELFPCFCCRKVPYCIAVDKPRALPVGIILMQVKCPQFSENPKEALRFFHENGYAVEYGVWTKGECAALRDEAAKIAPQGIYLPLMQPHEESRLFLSSLAKPSLVGILEQLVGGKISGIQSQFFFCRPGTRGFSMHQDNWYVEAPQEAFASAWSALEDVDQKNGALVVYPRTHLDGLFPVHETKVQIDDPGQDPNAYSRELELPEKFDPKGMTLEVPRGATVFLHANTVHSSHSNTTDNRSRNVLLMTYVRQGVPFRPGTKMRRREINVYEI